MKSKRLFQIQNFGIGTAKGWVNAGKSAPKSNQLFVVCIKMCCACMMNDAHISTHIVRGHVVYVLQHHTYLCSSSCSCACICSLFFKSSCVQLFSSAEYCWSILFLSLKTWSTAFPCTYCWWSSSKAFSRATLSRPISSSCSSSSETSFLNSSCFVWRSVCFFACDFSFSLHSLEERRPLQFSAHQDHFEF